MAEIRAIKGSVKVKHGTEPRIKLPQLEKGQYVVRLDTIGSPYESMRDRKTWDLRWTAWVVTP